MIQIYLSIINVWLGFVCSYSSWLCVYTKLDYSLFFRIYFLYTLCFIRM